MAEAAGYPKVPAKAWRVLRTRAATAPSTKFTPSTVAALLTMGSAASAQTSVVSPLQRLGLFDESGALTARGNKWRVDASYEDACWEILKDVYPDDLAALRMSWARRTERKSQRGFSTRASEVRTPSRWRPPT